jgi:hypothetical protein
MPITAFSAKTTNTQTSAIPVIPGNTYAFDLSGTFDSGVCTMQQTVDETNFRTDADFASMSAAGIQTFVATGGNVKFTLATGGASMSLTGKLKDLGGPSANMHPDFSLQNSQTTRTNS